MNKFVRETAKVFFSLSVALLIVEFSLAIATPSSKKKIGQDEVAQAEPAKKEDVQSPQPNKKVDHVPPGKKQKQACTTEFYATFKYQGKAYCLPNPTNQLAMFGPPSSVWFGESGGNFQVHDKELIATHQCEDLAKEPKFIPDQTALQEAPIDRANYHGELVQIDWVCAPGLKGGVQYAHN